jgi:hypothetical protein
LKQTLELTTTGELGRSNQMESIRLIFGRLTQVIVVHTYLGGTFFTWKIHLVAVLSDSGHSRRLMVKCRQDLKQRYC